MVRRHSNQLPDNIPQLQNLIKRDAASYKDEVKAVFQSIIILHLKSIMYLTFHFSLQFMQQYRHYQATMEVFRLHPDQSDKNLEEIVMFLAQVCIIISDNFMPRCLMEKNAFIVY